MEKFSGSLARRYGTALYESLFESSGHQEDPLFLSQTVEFVRTLVCFFDKKNISHFMNPALSNSQKEEILYVLLNGITSFYHIKIPSYLFLFLKLIIENKRFSVIVPILNFFLNKVDEHLGIARVSIVSASHLEKNEIVDFESALVKALNKKIIFDIKMDAALKSGFVIKLGNVKIDASLRSRLQSLKETLN